MFAIFRLLSAASAVVAFFQSPTGRRLVGQVRSFVAKRLDRRKANQAPSLPAGVGA